MHKFTKKKKKKTRVQQGLLSGIGLDGPALFALVAGISPMAQAQDDQSGLPAPTQRARLADTQRGLASPIEGSWTFAIDIIGQGTFNSLISFTAGGVVITVVLQSSGGGTV